MVDEVGYLPIDSHEAYLFLQIVSYRYEKNSTIITSNKSFGDWPELFGDTVIATTILDRLMHYCKVVNKGHSYRLRKHMIGKTGVHKADCWTDNFRSLYKVSTAHDMASAFWVRPLGLSPSFFYLDRANEGLVLVRSRIRYFSNSASDAKIMKTFRPWAVMVSMGSLMLFVPDTLIHYVIDLQNQVF